MAVSIANLPADSCNEKVIRKGQCVLLIWSLPGKTVETWVKKVAELSGQPVDWHWYGGKARVLALGNLAKVRKAIDALTPSLDAFCKQTLDQYHLPFTRLYMEV